MKQLAARVHDVHTCSSHGAGEVQKPGATNVLIGTEKWPAARAGDMCSCGTSTSQIIFGARPVLFGKKPAARSVDRTKDGGAIEPVDHGVWIGLAGISGNHVVGTRRCIALAAGRNPPPGTLDKDSREIGSGTLKQSYDNCALESARQIIQQVRGSTITQEDLMAQALANGWAARGAAGPDQMYLSGSSDWTGRVALLGANGVTAVGVGPTMEIMEDYVSQGAGVMVDVYAGSMPNWQAAVPGAFAVGEGPHTVLVTGVEYDADGKPINVFINDTGLGQCGKKIPYNDFKAALVGMGRHVVTNKAIW